MSETLITPDRLSVIRFLADMVKDVPGDALEVGVYRGGSLGVIAWALPHKTVYGYDTFAGLPAEKAGENEGHKAGDFGDTSMDRVRDYLRSIDAFNARLVQGIFPECTLGKTMPMLSFAHIDVDFGPSARACLHAVDRHLEKRGVIVVDDYGWHLCPNVKPVVDQFALEHGYEFYNPAEAQCWLRKK